MIMTWFYKKIIEKKVCVTKHALGYKNDGKHFCGLKKNVLKLKMSGFLGFSGFIILCIIPSLFITLMATSFIHKTNLFH